MSGSLTRVEIDDVLSSIRRLVSEDRSAEPGPAPRKPELLLLTPAQRVGTAAQDEGAQDDAAAWQEPDWVEPAVPLADEAAEAALDAALHDEDADPFAAEAAHAPPLEWRVAELEVAVSRVEEEWEPDGSEPQDAHRPTHHIFERRDQRLVLQPTQDDLAAIADGTSDSGEGAPGEAAEDGAPLQLADFAVFRHLPREAAEPEPEAAAESAPEDAPAAPQRPAAEVRALHPRGEAPAEPVTTQGDVLAGDDDVYLDEDMLRRVVAEIVREELQGTLGERITRNVRRMVRREIEQVLSLRSIE